jgi:hypothetical protein
MTANPPPTLPAQFEPLAAEMAVYYRELPRLLREGADGKYFVAKGDTGYGVWDTFHDAIQFGHHVFADGRFMAQKIDRRYLDVLPAFFGPYPAAEIEGV